MVVAKKSAYEESRQKRLEENKKRMEELNLNKLAQSLHTPKPSPMKKVKPKVPKQPLDVSAIRRSSRVADMPPRSYKESTLGLKALRNLWPCVGGLPAHALGGPYCLPLYGSN
ncbi:hypothetical protein OROGR_031527 [Orobanche gracilis]